jgi:DNA-binding NarL/FixJ family response regulator
MDLKTTVLIANTFPLIRKSMKALLDSTPNLEVIACAEKAEDLLRLADAHGPNVIVLDLELESAALTNLITKLASRNKHAILVMTDAVQDHLAVGLLQAGANGVVSRNIEEALLCRSVTAIARGEIWVSRSTTAQLLEHFRMRPAQMKPATASPSQPVNEALAENAPDYGLTRREWDILRGIGEAMSNKDIANQLGISEYTVKHHLTSIYNKVGVYSRLELAMRATHHGLVASASAVSV